MREGRGVSVRKGGNRRPPKNVDGAKTISDGPLSENDTKESESLKAVHRSNMLELFYKRVCEV